MGPPAQDVQRRTFTAGRLAGMGVGKGASVMKVTTTPKSGT